MRKMKKILAAVLAMVMVLAMGVSVSAATITIDGGASGSAYAAYKLMDVTQSGTGTEAKYSYTVNSKYEDVLEAVTGKTTQSDIADYISALDTSAKVRTFADAVYAAITAASLTADYTTDTDVFDSVDQGYYLIAETKTGTDDDTYSLVILNTAGSESLTVTTKEDTVELEKKVKETNDTTGDVSDWQDAADYDIGDSVPFQLTGTLPSNYDNYSTYYYAFHDVMSAGLTLDASSVKVYVDGTALDASEYTVVTDTAKLTDGCTFEVIITDLKQVSVTATASSKITVEYSATLNDNAEIGSTGNPNTAYLEFSNNPYGDGTGKTTEDKVIVFTYEIDVNKVDESGAALSGAGFTLYKYDATEGDYVAVGSEITGVTTFTFKGVDAGKYMISETTVPDGYNKADDIYFTVEATYDTTSDNPKLTDLTVKDADGNVSTSFTADTTNGTVSTDVENTTDLLFPSTGGIGAKIFYAVGAVLMFAVAAYLLLRKRSTKN